MIHEEINRIKNDTSKAAKMSKKSQAIVNTSVYQKLITIFEALDIDSNGVITDGDIDKALSGKDGHIFKPLIMQIAKHAKSIDITTFEMCFRDFLRVGYY